MSAIPGYSLTLPISSGIKYATSGLMNTAAAAVDYTKTKYDKTYYLHFEDFDQFKESVNNLVELTRRSDMTSPSYLLLENYYKKMKEEKIITKDNFYEIINQSVSYTVSNSNRSFVETEIKRYVNDIYRDHNNTDNSYSKKNIDILSDITKNLGYTPVIETSKPGYLSNLSNWFTSTPQKTTSIQETTNYQPQERNESQDVLNWFKTTYYPKFETTQNIIWNLNNISDELTRELKSNPQNFGNLTASKSENEAILINFLNQSQFSANIKYFMLGKNLIPTTANDEQIKYKDYKLSMKITGLHNTDNNGYTGGYSKSKRKSNKSRKSKKTKRKQRKSKKSRKGRKSRK